MAEGNAAPHAALRLLLHLRRRQQREHFVVVADPFDRVAVRVALHGAPDPQEALGIGHQTAAPASRARAAL